MSVLIEKIIFENYRQFGNGTLNFRTEGKCLLSAFIAKNGTGKTTLLNAITWCLYEEEFQTHALENDTLPSISTNLITDSNEGKTIHTSVTLTVLDEDKVIEFKRTLPYKIIKRGNQCHAIKDSSDFVVTVTAGSTNSKPNRGDDASALVKQYFDQNIYNFYFFDGEKLGEFFDVGKSRDIKESIFNISQISLLANAQRHADSLRNKLAKKHVQEGSSLENLYAAKENLLRSIEANTKARDKADKVVVSCKTKIADYDQQLASYCYASNYSSYLPQPSGTLFSAHTFPCIS